MTKALIKRADQQGSERIVMVDGVRVGVAWYNLHARQWLFKPENEFEPYEKYKKWYKDARDVRQFAVLCYNLAMRKNHDQIHADC